MTEKTVEVVNCRFHVVFNDPANKSDGTHSKCGGEAAGFVRMKHSGRLCPLCTPCKETFVQAQSSMSADVKKGLPGGGEYEEVSLDVGRDEFAKQPPKQTR